MSRFTDPLKNISVASPCQADWNEMYGDDRKRFCGECKLNVYNLSGMTRDEAEALVTNAEGRLCVRFYRRADGSVITQECPVGWAKLKQRTRIYATAVASLLIAMFSGVLFVSFFGRRTVTIGELKIPFVTPTPQPLMGAVAIDPRDREVMGDVRPIMGNVSVPTPTPKPNSKFEMGKMRIVTQDQERKNS